MRRTVTMEYPKTSGPPVARSVQTSASIDEKFFFIRGCLEIPVEDEDERFSWGVWVSLSESSFKQWVGLLRSGETLSDRPVLRLAQYPVEALSGNSEPQDDGFTCGMAAFARTLNFSQQITRSPSNSDKGITVGRVA